MTPFVELQQLLLLAEHTLDASLSLIHGLELPEFELNVPLPLEPGRACVGDGRRCTDARDCSTFGSELLKLDDSVASVEMVMTGDVGEGVNDGGAGNRVVAILFKASGLMAVEVTIADGADTRMLCSAR